MAKILVLHGPNLNLLGTREPGHYGNTNLEDINTALKAQAHAAGHECECIQSNAEHELVNAIQKAGTDGVVFILINPAAFTHSSIAIRDALIGVSIPFVEIHLSNVHAREPFRQQSYLSDIAVGTITGLGAIGYELGLQAACASIS